MNRLFLAAFLFLLGSCTTSPTDVAQSQSPLPAPSGESAASKPAPYPLATCIVSGKRLDTEAVTFTAGARTFRTCCAECQRTIERDVELWSAQVDAANIKEQLLNYPTDLCVVSGRTFGANATTTMHEQTLVRFCCSGCKSAFQKSPEEPMRRLATAKSASFGNVDLQEAKWSAEETAAFLAEQRIDYPLITCPVTGNALVEGKAVDILLEGTLVRLCCDTCVEKAKADSTAIVTKIQSAAFALQKMDYPLTTCPISGKPLGENAASTMVGVTMVRTCCTACVKEIAERREEVVSTLRAAKKERAAKANKSCCSDGDDCCCNHGN